jgi:HD-like signal output (HDOD) protein
MSNNSEHKRQLSSFTSSIPPFPKTVERVMDMLRDPRIQLTKVAEVVALDQGFSGKVLRMANSAYFGLPRQVYDVTEALVLLGYAHVRDVLVSASVGHLLMGGLEAYGLLEGVLWEHSVGTAYATQILSRRVDVRVYNMAFSSGLLHDVGKVAIDRTLDSATRRELRAAIMRRGPARAESEIVGFNHAEVGGEVCNRWNLPVEIVEAVEFHLEPNRAPSGGSLPALVAAADRCVDVLAGGAEEIQPSDFDSAPEGTHLPDPPMLEKLSRDLPRIIASAKQLLLGAPLPVEPEPAPEE